MFGYDNLKNYYETNFVLMHQHKYSLSDLDGLLPWERHIYLDLLKAHIKQQEEARRDREALAKRQR